MATISLPNDGWLFYIGGRSGASSVVGNDWSGGAVLRRVARQSFVAPSTGATSVSLTYHTNRGNGAFIPLRFYIGTDPDSHANAGPSYAYTGELTLGSDYLTHTGQADILLIPGQTYYIWVFPGSDEYGWYYGTRQNHTSTLVTSGAAMSDITSDNGTLGTEHTIKLTRYGTDMTHTLTAKCGSASLTIASGVKTDTVKWTPPISWAAQNTTETAVPVVITCTTYSGSTAVGSKSIGLSFSIPASVVPTATIATADAKGHLATYGSYVQGKSQLKVTVSADGAYGSEVISCVITCGNQTTAGTDVTFALPTSGSITVTAVVTDSRKRSATVSTKITVTAYAAPTVQITSAYRCDASGNENNEGSYGVAVFSASVTSLGAKNGAAYALKYRVRGTSSWTSIAISSLNGNYAPAGASQVFPADTTKMYEVCIVATDHFGSIESTYRVVGASFVLMESIRSLGSIGYGMRPTVAKAVFFGLKLMLFKGIKLTAAQVASWDVIDAALDAAVSNLEDGSIDFCLFRVGITYWHCILCKTDDELATAEFYSYAGRRRMILDGGTWQTAETI